MNWVASKRLVGLAFFALHGFVLASAPATQLGCKVAGDGAMIFRAEHEDIAIEIVGRADICSNGFEWLEQPKSVGTGYIIAAPLELGLQAKSTVFRLSFLDRTSYLVGELPAAAESVGKFQFINIFQELGSVFLDRYELSERDVRFLGTERELIFEGSVCLSNGGNVLRKLSTSRSHCKKILQASFESPVCLRYVGDHAVLASAKDCSKLLRSRAI